MSDWQRVRLADVAVVGMGQSPDSTSYNSDGKGPAFLQGCADFGERHPQTAIFCDKPSRIAPQGSILISVRAPVGEINWADKDYCVGRGLGYVAPGDAAIEYLYYAIKHARPSLDRISQGSTFSAISSQDLRGLALDLPLLPEQRKIARILSTVDDLIERTEALIAKYRAIKQGLMHDLLTRGVDASGRLRPSREEAPGLYRESPVGWVPREWKIQSCESICKEIIVGIVIRPAQYYVPTGVPTFRSANVREWGIDASDLVFITADANRLLSKSMLHAGDVITVRTGYPGTSYVVPQEYDGTNCIDLVISRPGSGVIADYLALWINSDFGKDQVVRTQGGLAQQHFNVGAMKRLLVALPEQREQLAISSRLSAHDAIIRAEEQCMYNYGQIKAGLMQDLLTGRVRVKI